MVIDIQNYTPHQQIVANILTQKESLGDQDINSRSTAFIVTECILGFFSVGIVTGIMEAYRYFISQPKVRAEFVAGIINLKNTLQDMAKPSGPIINESGITICGVNIWIHHDYSSNTVVADLDDLRLELGFSPAVLADRLAREIASHNEIFGYQCSSATFNLLRDENNIVERSICMKAIMTHLPNTNELMLATMPSKILCSIAHDIIRGVTTDADQVFSLFNPILTASRLNAEDALDLVSKLEKPENNNLEQVKKDITLNIPKYQSDDIKKQSPIVTAIRNMMADFISNEDTWTHDRYLEKNGEALLAAIIKHSATLRTLCLTPTLLDQCDLGMLSNQITSMLKALNDNFKDKMSSCLTFNMALQTLKALPANAPIKMTALAQLAMIEADIDSATQNVMQLLQEQVNTFFSQPKQNMPRNNKGNFDQNLNLFELNMDGFEYNSESSDIFIEKKRDSFGQKKGMIEFNENEFQSHNSDDSDIRIVSKKDNYGRKDGMIAFQSNIRDNNDILIENTRDNFDRNQDKSHPLIQGPMEFDDGFQPNNNITGMGEGLGIPVLEQDLDDMLVELNNDTTNPGYGQFVKNSLSSYFINQALVDQKTMLAASIRYAAAGASEIAKLGALLKGAGPILQKVLQGLDTSTMNSELLGAVRDMKCNLAPIPPLIVKAHLYDIIQKSHGEISKITVIKSLGAATVGEAFLCSITKKNSVEECVIKLLRPNVQVSAHRERQLFENVAKDIPGMSVTFQGQMKRIMDELNLTKEADNIKKGAIYEGKANNLHSVELSLSMVPRTNALMLKLVHGETVEGYIRLKEEEFQKMAPDVYPTPRPTSKDYNRWAQNLKGLAKLHGEVVDMRDSLASLVIAWVSEGVYGNGFFHGDLHAGNIIVSPTKGITVIDYGNTATLTNDQQSHITLMMGAGTTGNVAMFIKGFKNLLSDTGKATLALKLNQITAKLTEIMAKGRPADAGKRIAVCLKAVQNFGVEMPASIFNFSQCQIRLEGTMNAINICLYKISISMEEITTSLGLRTAFPEENLPTDYQYTQTLLLDLLEKTKGAKANLKLQWQNEKNTSHQKFLLYEIKKMKQYIKSITNIHDTYGIMAEKAHGYVTFASCIHTAIHANAFTTVRRIGLIDSINMKVAR